MYSRNFIFFVFFLFLLGGCLSHEQNSLLIKEATLLCDSLPEVALSRLNRIYDVKELNPADQAKYNLLMTSICLKTGTRMLSDSAISLSVNYYKQSKDTINLYESLFYKGLYLRWHAKYQESQEALLEACNLLPFFKDEKRKVQLYRFVAYNYLNLNDARSAVQLQAEILDFARNQNDTFMQIRSLIELSLACKYKNEYKVSICNLNEALTLAQALNNVEFQRRIYNDLADNFVLMNDYKQAYLSRKEAGRRVSRKDVPMMNLSKAILFYKQGLADSAYYYANIAIGGTDPFVANVAYSYLGAWEMEKGYYPDAYGFLQKENQTIQNIELEIHSKAMEHQYKTQKLENENNILKIKQKQRDLHLLGILFLFFVVVVGIYILYLKNKKKKSEIVRMKNEEQIKNKSIQLEHENLLLKQANELSVMREKEALLRESFFRRITLFQKIPSLSAEKNDDTEIKRHKILFSENDWKELVESVNEAYPGFSLNLQKIYPILTPNDICFCCFIKINVNLQDLSDIYCVSKAAITKRKYRLKTEKFKLTDESVCLDQFLHDF